MAWHNFVSLDLEIEKQIGAAWFDSAQPKMPLEKPHTFTSESPITMAPAAGAAPSCYPPVDCWGCYTLYLIRNAISGNRCRIFVIHVSKLYNQHSICLFSTELEAEKQDSQNLAKSFCMARRCNYV